MNENGRTTTRDPVVVVAMATMTGLQVNQMNLLAILRGQYIANKKSGRSICHTVVANAVARCMAVITVNMLGEERTPDKCGIALANESVIGRWHI